MELRRARHHVKDKTGNTVIEISLVTLHYHRRNQTVVLTPYLQIILGSIIKTDILLSFTLCYFNYVQRRPKVCTYKIDTMQGGETETRPVLLAPSTIIYNEMGNGTYSER